MSKAPLYWLAGFLTIMGSLFFGYKWMYMGYPLLPGTSADIWQIEVKLGFNAANEPIKVALYIPGNNRKFTLLDENFISRGFGLSTVREGGNRRAIWSVRTANGAQSLYYRTTVEQFDSGTGSDVVRVMPEVMDHGFTGAEFEVAKNILQSAQQQSADLDTLVAQLVKRATDPGDDDIALLLSGDTSPENRIRIATRLLALAYVPARMIYGLYMVDRRGDAQLEPWLEVFDETRWRPFDPVTGQTGIADNYLVFWRGDDSLVNIDGAENIQTRISLQKLELEAIEAATARRHYLSPVLEGMSLSSLPLATQNVYKILLLIPVGAFLLVIMRNIIGIKTFGTFMPVLIALSFRETQLLWGITLFCIVVTLGLSIRFALDRLKLLLVPRLTAVLTIVVLLMMVISIITNHFGIESGLSVALFPMVIITMTIERMSIVWDERGANDAIKQGLGSLFCAALAYLLMSNSHVAHLFTVFPELLLILLAATLLLGRYTGYRLLELSRFKALLDPVK